MYNLYQKFRLMWISIFNLMFVVVANIVTLPFRFKSKFKGSGSIHILGNGPSLKKDFERLQSKIQDGDSVLCINGSALTPMYKQLKPNIYMLVDDAFFSEIISDSVVPLIEGVYKELLATTWDLNLIVPVNKMGSQRLKVLDANKHIKIFPLLNLPVTGGFKKLNAYLYYTKLSTPLYQNILNAATHFAVSTGFKNVFLWGGDHDWLEERTVLSDNKMYAYDRHFYNPDNKKLKLVEGPSVATQMEFFMMCFRGYEEINQYAMLKGVKIINCSSKSWIDAFERESNV